MPRKGAPRKTEITLKMRVRIFKRLEDVAKMKGVTVDKIIDEAMEIWLLENT